MSFIQAGNEAVRAAYKARAAAERNKPKYERFGKRAIEDQTAQDLLSMEIRGRAQQAAIAAKSNEKTREIKQDAKDYYNKAKKQTQMAGKLAGGVALLGSAYFMSKKKDEPNEQLSMLEGYKRENREAIDKYQKEIDALSTESSTESITELDTDTQSTASKTDSQGSTSPKGGSATGVRLAKDLMAKGFSKSAAAAIAGNAQHESANFTAHEEFSPNSYGTKGVGFLQWTDAGGGKRRSEFEAFAKARNLDPTSYEASASYITHEMAGGRHWTGGVNTDSFKGSTDLTAATRSYMNNYLRPHKDHAHFDRRLSNAQSIFSQL